MLVDNKLRVRKVRNFDKWLSDYIRESGSINNSVYHDLMEEAENKKIPFHEVVIERGLFSSNKLIELAEEVLAFDVINLEEIDVNEEAFKQFPEYLIEKYNILPIKIDESKNQIIIAMTDPSDLIAIDEIKAQTKYRLKPVFAISPQIKTIIESFKDYSDIGSIIEEMNGLEINIEEDNKIEDVTEESEGDEPVIVRMVNSILSEAIISNASDIHIEPMEHHVRVRMRIDGLLVEKIKHLDKKFLPAIVSRIKVMSLLDIAESRKPQDGRFKVRISGKSVDIRVSTMLTQYGEKIVLRLANKSLAIESLESLGFSKEESDLVKKLSEKPYGLILTTGPTGSGKSTTLYGMLNYVNNPNKNIVTIEDPIERQIKGVIQTSVSEKSGVTFESGLRTILRQDPDIIMVGEIRDKGTAEMAIQAALTGHLVLSTLHTNDAAGSITRLIDMGVDAFKIPAAVLAVIAQRLIRRICPHCAEKYTPHVDELALLKKFYKGEIDSNIQLYKAVGCRKCSNTGYKGREGIFEILTIEDNIKELILSGASLKEIKQQAIENGMKLMEESAVEKVIKGVTTIDEIKRVIFVS